MEIIKYYTDYINAINEGHIKTYDSKISFNEIIRSLKLLQFKADGSYSENQINLILNDFNHIPKNKIDDLFDHISVILVNKFGWFPSYMKILYSNGHKLEKKYSEDELKLNQDLTSSIQITFESKFDKVENIIPDKLYHLSIQEYENKIMKYGLVPKSKSKLTSHLDRIYLCKSIQDCKSLIPQMKLVYSEEKDVNLYTLGNKKYRKNTKWIIFEIDTEKAHIDKLYKDPNYTDGYYYLGGIGPDSITIKEKE